MRCVGLRLCVCLLAIGACTKDGDRAAPVAKEPAPGVALRAKARPCPEDTQGHDVDLGSSKAVAIAAAGERACAILDDGGVMCWGNDMPEHVGLRPYADRAVPPERIRGLTDVVEIALYDYGGCARHAGGTIACWGLESPTSLPRNVARSKKLTSGTLALGLGHACVARSGAVHCAGELVPFGTFPSGRPVPGATGVSRIATTTGFGCAVTGPRVLCWGNYHNKYGTAMRAVPAPALAPATALALSPWDACALHPSGNVTCLREAMRDELVAVPVANLSDARDIALDNRDGCAVRATGNVACWTGIEGTASAEDPAVAVDVPGLHDAVDVALGLGFTCVVRASGRVRCWGTNDKRQLGIDTLLKSDVALEVCGLDQVTQVAVGRQHVCALRDGDVYCWGANHDGTLGSVGPHSAVPLRVPTARSIVQLVADHETTCALDRAGRVACWGRNPLWGSGRDAEFVLPTSPVRSIAIGATGICAITSTGHVTCNNQPVAGVTGAVRLVSRQFPCAEVADARGRRVVCWNTHFTRTGPAPPDAPIPTVASALDLVDCGDHGPCGLTSNRELVCRDSQSMADASACKPWHPDRLDELAPDPLRIHLACELLANGLVKCAGLNGAGQLGTGKMELLVPGK